MTKSLFPMIAAGAVATLAPVAAIAAFAVGDTLGTDVEEIRSKLEAQGYTVTEIEIKDGEIEVEYVADGQEYEVTMSGETGQVLEVELEDDDDD